VEVGKERSWLGMEEEDKLHKENFTEHGFGTKDVRNVLKGMKRQRQRQASVGHTELTLLSHNLLKMHHVQCIIQ
jgi:hypothetical protein